MNKIQSANLFLLALKQYEPDAYLEEVSEIFSCIMENKVYDEAPDLSQKELIVILENLEMDTLPEQNRLQRLTGLASKKVKVAEEVETALRSRIRRILLGS